MTLPEPSVFTPVTQALLVLALTATAGLGLGRVRFFGASLGVAGVLFAGLILGHLGFRLDDHLSEFIREFGLILFVYTIGVQVGPGFFASLRKTGLPLNALALALAGLGVLTALAAHFWGGVDGSTLAGLLAGATTNTPSLASAQQALRQIPGLPESALQNPALGYAVAYPFGLLGILLTMTTVKRLFRVKIEEEVRAFEADRNVGPALTTVNIEITNANLSGVPLARVPVSAESGVVVSRIVKNGKVHVAHPDTLLEVGDVLLAVGPAEKLEDLRLVAGKLSDVNVQQMPADIIWERVLVTRRDVLGRTLAGLDLSRRLGLAVTRLSRSGVEMPAFPHTALQFGDTLALVGSKEAVGEASRILGNSPKELNMPQLVPIFIGIGLGVLAGVMPLHIPGAPAPIKLGLAGGPLVMAILLSRLGRIGRIVWYMPSSANHMLREIGITLFLSCVGLKAGARFVETLTGGDGLTWLLWGAAITAVPLLTVGIFARKVMKLNYVTLCGILAGGSTNPPALAFANAQTGGDGPALSYATVYPLTMLLRVVSTQLIALFLAR